MRAATDLDTLLASLFDAVVLVDPESGVLLGLNPAARTLLRFSGDDPNLVTIWRIDPDTELDHDEPTHRQAVWRTFEGALRRMEVRQATYAVAGVGCVVLVAREVPVVNHPSLQLSVQEVVGDIPDFVTVLDSDRRVRFTNRTGTSGVSNDDVVGSEVYRFVREEHREAVRASIDQVFETAAAASYEMQVNLPDGSTRLNASRVGPILRDGEVVGVTIVSTDMTERARREATRREQASRWHHKQRLESLGTLVAGIAHDINNPLMYIRANLEYLHEQLAAAAPRSVKADLGPALEDALDGAERIRRIVDTISPLSRESEDDDQPADVVTILNGALKIAGARIRERARLVRDFESGLPLVRGGSYRLGQVFLNLLINAMKALPLHGDNEVRVSAHRAADGRVRVEVADSGAGVPDEIRDQIFEPFFTTRPQGEGTGLGLSSAYAIVTAAGGEIALLPSSGRGAAFEVHLPAVADAHPTVVHEPGASLRLGCRVLVVDDELMLLRLFHRMGLHHEVETASSALLALRRLLSDRFDVVLCDVMMPSMTGGELYAEACEHDPSLASRFVFMTGGAFDSDELRRVEATGCEVLLKPFTLDQLSAAVDRALDQPRP